MEGKEEYGKEHGMGRGAVRNVQQQQQQLRRPNTANVVNVNTLATETQKLNLNSDECKEPLSGFKGGGDVSNHCFNQLSDSTSNSEKKSLNPFAPTFVPRFMSTMSIAATTTTANNEQCYSGNQVNGDSWSDPGLDQANGDLSDGSKRSEADDYVALNELKEFIDLISSQPAQYEAQLSYITDVLNHWIDEDEEIILYCVVNTIVDQAIVDPNFRYNGVRFCIHLIANLQLRISSGSFKELLLQRCQREHSRREHLAVHSDRGAYLRGLTLFIGELASRSIDNTLITQLADLITTLMEHPTTENLKCCIMVLKMCGTTLEENTPMLNKIVERLQKFVDSDQTSASIKEMIKNVIDLRNNGWKTIPVASFIPNPYASGDVAEINYDNNQFESYPYYDFGPCGDEQDADVCEAFDEFLRASGQLQ